MIEWLHDGLEGRSLKATLCLYLSGLVLLAPAAILTWLFYGADRSFQATPVLVLVLVTLQFAVAYRLLGLRTRSRKKGISNGVIQPLASTSLELSRPVMVGFSREDTRPNQSFAVNLWEELRPIITHGVMTAFAVLLIAGLTWLVDIIPDTQSPDALILLNYLEWSQRLLSFLLLTIFGVSTIAQILISFVVVTLRNARKLRRTWDSAEKGAVIMKAAPSDDLDRARDGLRT